MNYTGRHQMQQPPMLNTEGCWFFEPLIYKPGSVGRGVSARTVISLGARSPVCSSSLPAVCLRAGHSLTAYLTLLRLGFAVPLPLPSARWALTPPFHPYLRSSAGGLFSVALSVVHMHAQELPGNPAQWSPDFPRMAAFASRDRPISSVPKSSVD